MHKQLLPTWTNAKAAASSLQPIRTHAKPTIGDRPLVRVTTADLRGVLAPLRTGQNETARRLKRGLAAIVD